MEISIYLFLGIMGVIAHCLIKANSLNVDAKKLNVVFNFKDYIKSDWYAIGLSFISVGVWLLIFGEVAQQYPKIQNFTRVSFFVMGLVGSYIIQTLLSRSKSYLRSEMKENSTIAKNGIVGDRPKSGGGR